MSIYWRSSLCAICLLIPCFSPDAPAAGSIDAARPELVQGLKRFHVVYRAPNPKHVRKIATQLAKVLDEQMAKDEAARDVLAYYAAECAYTMGDLEKARKFAKPIASDLKNVNVAEAIRLISRIKTDIANKVAGELEDDDININIGEKLRAIQTWYFKSIAICYPCGSVADRLLFHTESYKPSLFPTCDIAKTCKIGGLYVQIGLHGQAVKAYGRTIGFLEDSDWVSPMAADIWGRIADCHMSMGHWELALAYYYKAIASRGPVKDLSQKVRKAADAINRKMPAPKSTPNPDAATLERIARLYSDTQLFDDAIDAALSARRLSGITDSNSKLLAGIYTAKANALKAMIAEYGEGKDFRGSVLSKKSVDTALRKAQEELSRSRQKMPRGDAPGSD